MELLGLVFIPGMRLNEPTVQDTFADGNGTSFRNMRATQRVTSGGLLTKQATTKKMYYVQKICTYLSYFST
jgi:hypothetical protein